MRPVARTLVVLVFLVGVADAQDETTISIRGKDQQLHLYGSHTQPAVILSSGDLGWAGLVMHVADFLSSHGYYVIGFNTKTYLSSFTTKKTTLRPEDVPQDYQVLIEFARRSSAGKAILAGVSEGAGLSVLTAANPSSKSRILGVLGLGLPDQTELGWHWQDFTIWITKRNPDEPSFMVEDVIGKVAPIPLAEIHATHDEFLSIKDAQAMMARASNPKKMWVIEAANHRFSDARDELDRRLLEAIAWIKASQKITED